MEGVQIRDFLLVHGEVRESVSKGGGRGKSFGVEMQIMKAAHFIQTFNTSHPIFFS
jgi:hypothetical protein